MIDLTERRSVGAVRVEVEAKPQPRRLIRGARRAATVLLVLLACAGLAWESAQMVLPQPDTHQHWHAQGIKLEADTAAASAMRKAAAWLTAATKARAKADAAAKANTAAKAVDAGRRLKEKEWNAVRQRHDRRQAAERGYEWTWEAGGTR